MVFFYLSYDDKENNISLTEGGKELLTCKIPSALCDASASGHNWSMTLSYETIIVSFRQKEKWSYKIHDIKEKRSAPLCRAPDHIGYERNFFICALIGTIIAMIIVLAIGMECGYTELQRRVMRDPGRFSNDGFYAAIVLDHQEKNPVVPPKKKDPLTPTFHPLHTNDIPTFRHLDMSDLKVPEPKKFYDFKSLKHGEVFRIGDSLVHEKEKEKVARLTKECTLVIDNTILGSYVFGPKTKPNVEDCELRFYDGHLTIYSDKGTLLEMSKNQYQECYISSSYNFKCKTLVTGEVVDFKEYEKHRVIHKLNQGSSLYGGDYLCDKKSKRCITVKDRVGLEVVGEPNKRIPQWLFSNCKEDCQLSMQMDGNLVMYNEHKHPFMSSGTNGQSYCTTLTLNGDYLLLDCGRYWKITE